MSLSEEEFDTDTDEPSIEKNLPSPPADKENDDTIGVTFVEAFRNPTPDLQIAVQSTPVETMDEQPDESVTEVLDFEHVQPLERPDTVTGITEIFQAENELDQGAISVIEPRQRVDSHLVETNTSFHTALDHTRGNSSFDSTSTMERRQIDQDVDEEVEELEELDLLLQESSMDQRTPIIPASRSIDEFSAEQTPTIRSLNDVRSIHASALEVAQLVAEMKAKDESIADLSQQTFELTHRETELQLQLANLSEKLKLSEIQRRRFSGNYDGHLESLERQIQEEKAMRNQLLAENEVLSEKCSQCQASLEQLEARYNLELNEFNEMKESEDQLINSIQNLKKNVSSSQFDLQERGRENRELEGIVSSQEKLLQGLTSKVSEAEETIQKLSLSKKELAVVKKEKTDLESDMVRMSRELDKVLPENKTLLDECEYLKTALDETESENRTLKSENNAMAIRLRSLEKENASISEDLGAQTTRSKSAIDQLTVNYESLIEDLEEKNQRVDDCIGRLQTLATCYETKIENLQTQLEKTRDAHQGLTLENNRLKTELKNVTGALSSNELTLVQLQRHTEETRAQQGEHKISLKLSEDKTRAVQSQLKEAHNEWALKESLLLEELAEYKSKERQNAERNETGALHQARIDNDQLREMILDKDLYLDIFQKELSKSQVLVRDSQVLLQTLQEMKAQEEIAKISLPLSQAGKENASIQSPERRQHSHSQKESLTESYSSEKGKARREKSLGLDQPLTRSMLEPQSPVRLNRGEIFNYSHIDSTRNNPSKVILSPSRKPLDRIDLDLLSPKVALILLRRRQRVSQDRDTD